MKTLLSKIVVAVLLIISLIALTPKLTLANQQSSQAGIVVINVSGNAEAINNGLSGSVTLNLVGAGSKDASQDLQISNMTGTLSIDSRNLTVSDGHGSANAHGDIALFANTSLAGNMLFLHGTVQGNTVTFISPESRLSLVSLLSLTGSINVNGVTEATSQSQSTNENTSSLNSTSNVLAPNVNSSTLMGNVTSQNTTTVLVPQTSNSSLRNLTSVSTAVANTTSTSVSDSTMSSSNSTVSEVVVAITSDSTTSQTTNQTTTTATINSALPPQTTTVTVTQFNNQTIIETHTVASVTITYTTTTTLANTTITQPNATTTTSNSTSTTFTP